MPSTGVMLTGSGSVGAGDVGGAGGSGGSVLIELVPLPTGGTGISGCTGDDGCGVGVGEGAGWPGTSICRELTCAMPVLSMTDTYTLPLWAIAKCANPSRRRHSVISRHWPYSPSFRVR